MKHRLPYIALALCVAEVLLVLVVWMRTAIEPHLPLRSPLSPEGIRWLFGRYTHSLATPLLAWLVLCVMAYGTLTDSGLWWVWHRGRRRRGVRERFAWHIVVAEAALVVVIMLLLTAMPQAILLSVTGGLWPSRFSYSLVPVVCFSLMVMGVTYGLVSDKYRSLADVFAGVCSGFSASGSLFVLLVLASVLWHTLQFILSAY